MQGQRFEQGPESVGLGSTSQFCSPMLFTACAVSCPARTRPLQAAFMNTEGGTKKPEDLLNWLVPWLAFPSGFPRDPMFISYLRDIGSNPECKAGWVVVGPQVEKPGRVRGDKVQKVPRRSWREMMVGERRD